MKYSKSVLILFFIFLCAGLNAQDSLQRNPLDSNSVVVHKDQRLDLLIKKQIEINEETSRNARRSAKGFRLMVLNTDKREDAIAAKTKVYTYFPESIYGIPHFDFHFYLTSPEEVAAIPAYEVDSLKFKNWPAPDYFPTNYFNAGGGVPQMGVHWIDITSPEFNGQPFTQTFIYGSYDGKVTFYEPMITLDFLKNNSNFTRDIPQPAKVQQSGYYPTKLRVTKHDGVTEIILDGFRYRTQS